MSKRNPLTDRLEFYQECLQDNADALRYLKLRGISKRAIEEYKLGYCPRNRGASMLEGRILFPLLNMEGEVLTYQGRALDSKVRPKYYHSKTKYYDKSKHIYGLSQIALRNPKPKKIVILEGPMDVILLAQNNVDAVCTFGTSLSIEHVFTLASVCKSFDLSYDNDETGKMASTNAAPLLQSYGLECNITFTPGGMKDWCEYLEAYGKKETKKETARCYAL